LSSSTTSPSSICRTRCWAKSFSCWYVRSLFLRGACSNRAGGVAPRPRCSRGPLLSFAQVRIKIKHMEIAIIKRESTGTGANTYNETETVAKFEIMDGAPVRGEREASRILDARSLQSMSVHG
jgi:hypothetical protein